MPVGLVPIDEAASVLRVDFHVVGTAHAAAVLDSSRLEALENGIKFSLIDSEAEMLNRKGPSVVDEVERQSIVDVHRRERSDTRFRPPHTKQVGEPLG